MSETMEPTDAMVDEAANAMSIDDYGTGLDRRIDSAQRAYLKLARITLRAALNHPDAAGLFADEDALRAAREQGWDDAAQHIYNKGWEGVGALRKANPHRPVQELPTEDGAVIVPAEGREFIEARVYNKTYRAREAVRHWAGGWHAAWRSGPEVRGVVAPEEIVTGTWKTADDPR